MAQEEMSESAPLTKSQSSVVDDFLAALFSSQPDAPTTKDERGVKRDRTPDEFDEYEMLSKRKQQENTSSTQKNHRDQVIPEARMVVRGLPHASKKRDILDYFSKYGPILDAYFKDTSGFIQFGSREACMAAYHAENGALFRDSQLATPPPARFHEDRRKKFHEVRPPRNLEDDDRYRRPYYKTRPHDNENVVNDHVETRFRGRGRAPFRGRGMSHPRKQYERPVRNDHYAPKSTSLLQKRVGKDVPIVQVVAWGNVSHAFTDYIEKSFRMRSISIHTMYLQYNQVTRDEVVTHLIMEGVKALLVVDHSKEMHHRVYLQVFEPDESHTGSFRFDEYDSIAVEEAIAVIQRACQRKYPSSLPPPMQQQHPPAPAPQPPRPIQQQPQVPVPMPAIDPNTLSSLITLVKGMVEQQQQQQQQQQTYTPSPIPAPQQQKPEQAYSALPNISPAVLNSPAVQQLLAQMKPASAPSTAPTTTPAPAYSVPTSSTAYYGSSGYGSNYGQQQQQPPTAYPDGNYSRYQQPPTSSPANAQSTIGNIPIGDILDKLQMLTQQTPLPQRQ
ncbi:hypothetical protein BJV82DRAFT_582714 [Fennellomyces sp. T-0311]|nr:hypothetical protein BJV82DRAFT_582714 [Fennellomyces sp. T-0311]